MTDNDHLDVIKPFVPPVPGIPDISEKVAALKQQGLANVQIYEVLVLDHLNRVGHSRYTTIFTQVEVLVIESYLRGLLCLGWQYDWHRCDAIITAAHKLIADGHPHNVREFIGTVFRLANTFTNEDSTLHTE